MSFAVSHLEHIHSLPFTQNSHVLNNIHKSQHMYSSHGDIQPLNHTPPIFMEYNYAHPDIYFICITYPANAKKSVMTASNKSRHSPLDDAISVTAPPHINSDCGSLSATPNQLKSLAYAPLYSPPPPTLRCALLPHRPTRQHPPIKKKRYHDVGSKLYYGYFSSLLGFWDSPLFQLVN